MENIEKALIILSEYVLGRNPAPGVVGDILIGAQKEVDALKRAGITVKKVESITVEGPARKRGRKAK